MAGHFLIDDHLAALRSRLPADTVAELADGLTETWQRHLAAGRAPTDAARMAVAEFGTPEQITAAFVAQAPGRRTALLLLATGPVVGACWGASLIAARCWTWPVPPFAAIGYWLVLLAVVVALAAAATSRHSYRRTGLGTVGAAGLIVLDGGMLAAALFIAPALAWPMFAAVPASLARIGVVLRLVVLGGSRPWREILWRRPRW